MHEAQTRIRVLDEQNTALQRSLHEAQITSERAIGHADSVDATVDTLCRQMAINGVSVSVQDFANRIIDQCLQQNRSEDGIFLLKQKNKGVPRKYKRLKLDRSLKTDALPESRMRRVRKRVSQVMDNVEGWDQDTVIEMLKALGKRLGLFFAKKEDLQMSLAQSVVLRDHVKTGTNGLYRMKQAIKFFCPALKGFIIPPSIRANVSLMENDGVIPSKIVQVCCTATKKGNRKTLNTFYYCSHPTKLLANMMRRMFLDNSFEDSIDFCSLSEMLIVSVGFDKSDSDFVGTWRPCNRRKGNSALFVQTFACLEGPVSEDYANEIVTIGKPEYPIRDTVQRLVDDSLYALVATATDITQDLVTACSCFVFMPAPTPPPGTQRPIAIELLTAIISESVAFGDEENQIEGSPDNMDDDAGWAPTVRLPLTERRLKVCLVSSNTQTNTVVGLSIYVKEELVFSYKLPNSFKHPQPRHRLELKCYQLSGQLSNDGKQISILTGQGSCSVSYPMPCCMVSKADLGKPPEWIQRQIRRNKWWLPEELHDNIIDLISSYLGKPITKDAPARDGEFGLNVTHAKWNALTVGGKYKLNAEERSKANKLTGSSFNEPIFTFPCKKQNCGIMHDPAGHITHFFAQVSDAIRSKMKGCKWQQLVFRIDNDVDSMIKAVTAEMKRSPSHVATKVIMTRIRQIRKERKRLTKLMEQDAYDGDKSQTREQIDQLEREEDSKWAEHREASAHTELGLYNLILEGLKDFTVILKERNKLNGKRPQSDLEYALWRAVESRAGGKLDMKTSGKEQTNGKGMISLQNFHNISDTLLGMYPQEHEVHQWLVERVKEWNGLAKAIFDVGCFLKSQKKRCPRECDDKLFSLWCRWSYAFPGMKFNKFHGMFCAIRKYVHEYHMAGRISEESNEAFNATLAEIKGRLRCMPVTSTRIKVTNARTQSNLNGEMLDNKVKLKAQVSGKKRGPQNVKAKVLCNLTISNEVREYVVFKEQRYLKLSNGNLLPEAWEDLYNWFRSAIAPKAWREGMANTVPSNFSTMERAKEEFTQF